MAWFFGILAFTVIVGAAVEANWRKFRYLIWPTETRLELYLGTKITLVVMHRGLSVRVRARVQLWEFSDRPDDFDPYDVHFSTSAYGGASREVELSGNADFAKATIGALEGAEHARNCLRLSLPRREDFKFTSRDAPLLLVLNLTLFVSTPRGIAEQSRQYKLRAEPGAVDLAFPTASEGPVPLVVRTGVLPLPGE